ncbi:MAG: replication factor C large subunit [Nanobdellota archaeon]
MPSPWTKKYQPASTKEIIGQEEQMNRLRDFVNNYKKQKKKAALLYGTPGSGKTSSVHALAKELDLEIIEVNASDFRNKAKIDSIVGNAMKQVSLFGKSKIILVDEMDGLSGTKDRGGIPELTKLLQKSSFPIILTANNPWHKKFNTLRKKAELIEFNPLTQKTVYQIMEKICKEESIEYDERTLKTFSRRAGTDLRGAINDLQTLTQDKKLTKESLEDLNERNTTEPIINALLKIFKTTDAGVAKESLDNVDEDHDECMLWIDENLPREYEKPEDLARAYEMLSRADVFRRRIKRRQHWRFLVYIYALISAGIATAKDEKYKKFTKYRRSQRPLKIWRANMKNQKRNAIAQKIAEKTHSSVKDTIKSSLRYIAVTASKNKQVAEDLELEKDELDWLKKSIEH